MLTRTAEYALRAVIHLAQHHDEWPIPGNRIAECADIPAKYLSKVLGDLVRVGVLTSSRGKHGGFGMVRSPKKMRLIDILTPFEQFEIRRCPFGNSECGDEKPCPAHDQWKKVVATEHEFFRRTSVHDVSIQHRRTRGRRGRAGFQRLVSHEADILPRSMVHPHYGQFPCSSGNIPVSTAARPDRGRGRGGPG